MSGGMTRHAITAVLVVALVAVSGPATVASAVTADESDTARAETVVVRNAQVDTLQLNDSTVENVTIRVLRIDRMTVQNQTDGQQLNETLGADDGPVVLRNVHLRNLSLENVSASSVQVTQTGPDGDVRSVGNVSTAVIPRMTVDHLVVQESNVRDGGGLISDVVDFVRGLFGGDDDQAGNATVQQADLRIANVDVNRLTVEQLNVSQIERVEPDAGGANETAANATTPQNESAGAMTPQAGADAGANQTAFGQVSVGNATIGTLSADALVYQQPEQAENETETPTANATGTPGGNQTTPTPA